LGLELRAKLVPVDEIRPDERRYQSDDEGDRQSEQRRLHGLSSRVPLDSRFGAFSSREPVSTSLENALSAAAPKKAGAGTPGNMETSKASSQRHRKECRSSFGRASTRTGAHPAKCGTGFA